MVEDYRHRMEELGPRVFAQDVLTTRGVVGAAGVLPGLDGWDWEVSATYGMSSLTEASTGNLYKDRMQYALQGCTDEGAVLIVLFTTLSHTTNEDGEMEYYYYDNPTGVSELSGLASPFRR